MILAQNLTTYDMPTFTYFQGHNDFDWYPIGDIGTPFDTQYVDYYTKQANIFRPSTTQNGREFLPSIPENIFTTTTSNIPDLFSSLPSVTVHTTSHRFYKQTTNDLEYYGIYDYPTTPPKIHTALIAPVSHDLDTYFVYIYPNDVMQYRYIS